MTSDKQAVSAGVRRRGGDGTVIVFAFAMLKNFRTYHVSVRFYRLCEEVRCPRHLREQLSRASSSIALNLSEGTARPTRRDRKRSYSMAMSSLRECQTILELANIPVDAEVSSVADSLGGQIYRLLQTLLPTPDEQASDQQGSR
ncbi:MAG: four helix bundle protein [Deltaproteobacteria bacterium]|nr:four helix bundle protein [Deltaproteobacteria bacterium]